MNLTDQHLQRGCHILALVLSINPASSGVFFSKASAYSAFVYGGRSDFG